MTALVQRVSTLPSSEPAPSAVLEGWPVVLETETSDGDARLRSWWYAKVEYEYPATWTIAEARDAMERFAAEAARFAAVNAITALPDDLALVVCPQIAEIVEYETRMADVRARPARTAIQQATTVVKQLA